MPKSSFNNKEEEDAGEDDVLHAGAHFRWANARYYGSVAQRDSEGRKPNNQGG